MRAVVVLCCVLTLAVACQPFGGPGTGGSEVPSGVRTDRPLGAPGAGVPSTLGGLIELGNQRAVEWQEEPVLSEVEVDIDETGAWSAARLTYLAADADRMLQLVAAGGGFTEQRPSLASLQLQPVPQEGLDELPEFPTDAAPPEELATSEAAQDCGLSGALTVLYVTGAPIAWDGTQWSTPPQWRVTVAAADGAGAQLTTSGEPAGDCLEAEPPSS